MVEMWRHNRPSRAKPGAITKELLGARLDIQVMEAIAKEPMTINDLSEIIYGNRYSQNLYARINRLKEDGLINITEDKIIYLRPIKCQKNASQNQSQKSLSPKHQARSLE